MGGRKVPNLVLRDLDEIANRSLNAHCSSNISGDFKFEGFRILREPEQCSIFASKIYLWLHPFDRGFVRQLECAGRTIINFRSHGYG